MSRSNLAVPRLLACLLSLVLPALCACGDDDGVGPPDRDAGPDDAGPPPPPERCAAFTAPGPGPTFRDATDAWGIGPGGLDVLANRVAVSDLDGDGYPDVVVHRTGSHNRADFTTAPRSWPYRVLLNRERDGGRELVDVTRESGYGALATPEPDVGRAAHFAVFADLDGDGDRDVFGGTYADRTQAATDPGDRSVVLLNDGTGTFTRAPADAAVEGSEVGQAMPTSAATILDHDRDGMLDLFVGYWYAEYGRSLWGIQDRLIRNVGDARFEDVTDAVGLATSGMPGEPNASRPTYGVTACDVDTDGDADLIVSAYGRQWNQLWLRDGDGYVELGGAVAADDATDYSDSEFYKCYCATTGACSADPPRIACDRPLWNAGLDDQPFRLNGNTFSTACADVDDDGDQDLYHAEIVHWHIGASSDSSELVVNEGAGGDGRPTFARPGNAATGLSVPRVGTSWNEGGISAGLADLDNDGRLDAVLGTSDYPDQLLWLYRRGADGRYVESSELAGIRHPCAPGFSFADLDRDGDLDLLVASGTARDCATSWPDGPPLRIYENVGGQDANWTQVRLEGSGSPGANRDAIGAIVRVTAGGVTRTREVQAGHGHFGLQHDLDVTVGLGDSCRIDAVEINWPDAVGTTERFEDVVANYRVTIRQGEGLVYIMP